MPKQTVNGFPMADHWIRVHSEVPAPSHHWEPSMRSSVVPTSAFLRIISLTDESNAREIVQQLKTGASFSDLARKYSRDSSASEGGYLGEKQLQDLDPQLAASVKALRYGELSPIVPTSDKFVILLRMPVDFRSRAMQLEREASLLRDAGDLKGALTKYQQAVDAFPGFLRAYILMAQLEEQLGNSDRAGELLERTASTHPDDATALFNLGIVRSTKNMGEEAIVAYRKALDLEPEFMPAYLNLGLLLFSLDRVTDAEVVFRRGLLIDPISAPMYYGLALAAARLGHMLDARRAFALAKNIDPDYVKQQQAH
jgi:tetratricopeptide (TPR) repeat protein